MTQIFTDAGTAHAVTIINAAPNTVTQVKTKDIDGYVGAQIGFGVTKEKSINKPQVGHLKGFSPMRHLREYNPGTPLTKGDAIDVSIFAVGDTVQVSAISKGKGYQGVVKRHGFSGGPRSHGQKNKERAPGSISGAGRAGGRVSLGMRMGGRMGGDRITVRNLKVLHVDVATNILLISGAVPGKPGTLVEIRG